jgi:competence protein ComEC
MDDIQRKLALIDKELAGGRNLHKQIVSTYPLIFIAAGLITGILIQNILDWSIKVWLIPAIFYAVATFILFAIAKPTYRPYISAYLACLCFVCLGATRLSSYHQPRPDDIRNFVTSDKKLATIRGLIITDPYISKNLQWHFAKFTYGDPTTSFYLKLKEVQTIEGWASTNGTILAQVVEPVLDLKAGDYVQAYCWLDRFKTATNPGQFDIAKHLARRNIFITASIESRDSINIKRLKSRHMGYLTRLKRKLRQTATQALLGDLSLEDRSRGLLQALLLGYRGDIDSATYEAFRTTGLLHFISLSGMHLGILVGIIWWLCKTIGLMKRARAIICIIVIGVFLLIVPPRAPTLRAAIIGFVFCISFLFRRHSNPLNALSLAAIVLLLIRPTQLFEPGWQLSFAAVCGILTFTDKTEIFLHERTNNWFRETRKRDSNTLIYSIKWLGGKIITLFSVGFAAWLGGAGILLYHFYTINPLTSIWTVIVFPFVALILAVGYLKIIFSFLLPTVALGLGIIVTGLCVSMIWIVERIAEIDVSQILIGHVPLTPIILYYCLIPFTAFAYFRRPLLKKAICAAMALLIVIFLGVTKWQRTYRANLALICLDVGHGQAILAQLPGKANILFDAGSMHKRDVGERIVVPFLDYSGINKIDAIIISHNDIDHINGIPEIVGHCEVSNVYANDAFLTDMETDLCDTAGTLKTALSNEGLEIQRLDKYLNFGSSAHIKILWPSKQICRDEELSDNDKSVVSLIEFAGAKILLCSDIEKFAQQELLQLSPNLKADIVVVPHHGLAKTLEFAFLESFDANILICSCGQNQYERISPTLQSETHDSNKTKSLYTAKDGAITVCINKDGAIKTDVFVK